MNRTILAQGTLRKIGRWLKQRFSGEKGLQKWQALLNGKSLDDQLWAVRPPQKAFEIRAIKTGCGPRWHSQAMNHKACFLNGKSSGEEREFSCGRVRFSWAGDQDGFGVLAEGLLRQAKALPHRWLPWRRAAPLKASNW